MAILKPSQRSEAASGTMTCGRCGHILELSVLVTSWWMRLLRRSPAGECAACDPDDIGNGWAGGAGACGCRDRSHRVHVLRADAIA